MCRATTDHRQHQHRLRSWNGGVGGGGGICSCRCCGTGRDAIPMSASQQPKRQQEPREPVAADDEAQLVAPNVASEAAAAEGGGGEGERTNLREGSENCVNEDGRTSCSCGNSSIGRRCRRGAVSCTRSLVACNNSKRRSAVATEKQAAAAKGSGVSAAAAAATTTLADSAVPIAAASIYTATAATCAADAGGSTSAATASTGSSSSSCCSDSAGTSSSSCSSSGATTSYAEGEGEVDEEDSGREEEGGGGGEEVAVLPGIPAEAQSDHLRRSSGSGNSSSSSSMRRVQALLGNRMTAVPYYQPKDVFVEKWIGAGRFASVFRARIKRTSVTSSGAAAAASAATTPTSEGEGKEGEETTNDPTGSDLGPRFVTENPYADASRYEAYAIKRLNPSIVAAAASSPAAAVVSSHSKAGYAKNAKAKQKKAAEEEEEEEEIDPAAAAAVRDIINEAMILINIAQQQQEQRQSGLPNCSQYRRHHPHESNNHNNIIQLRGLSANFWDGCSAKEYAEESSSALSSSLWFTLSSRSFKTLSPQSERNQPRPQQQVLHHQQRHGQNGNSRFLILDLLSETLQDRLRRWKTEETSSKGKLPLPSRLLYLRRRRIGEFQQQQQQDLQKQRDLALVDRVRSVALPMARAMSFLHAHRICYRDLKPANVGFDAHTGELKIFDFGLSRQLMPFASSTTKGVVSDAEQKLLTGFTGTPRYMAPEVMEMDCGEGGGKSPFCSYYAYYGIPADVYSYAIVVWELMTLRRAYPSLQSGNATLSSIQGLVLRKNVRPSLSYVKLPEPPSTPTAVAATTATTTGTLSSLGGKGSRNGEFDSSRNRFKPKSKANKATLLLRELICASWHRDPEMRPSFATIVHQLERLLLLYDGNTNIDSGYDDSDSLFL